MGRPFPFTRILPDMLQLDAHPTGRHFLQIPGPSPVPDRILRAMSLPTIDHRGPEFGQLGLKVLAGIQQVFKTRHPVVIYPASGTGAWEAALINTLSPGDHVLMFETGHFASLWQKMATRLGLSTEFLSYGGSDEHLPQAPGWPLCQRSISSRVLLAIVPAQVGAPSWSATIRWMDCRRSVVGAGVTMCPCRRSSRCPCWSCGASGDAGGGAADAAGETGVVSRGPDDTGGC